MNFDWGSQSIAQSKFQRAPFKGKGFYQSFSPFVGQLFFSRIEKNLNRRYSKNTPFVIRPASNFEAGQPKGRGTCNSPLTTQEFSRERIGKRRNTFISNKIELHFYVGPTGIATLRPPCIQIPDALPSDGKDGILGTSSPIRLVTTHKCAGS